MLSARSRKYVSVTICDILTRYTIEEFCIPFINKQSELDLNPTTMTYMESIYLVDSKYQSLLDAHLWVHQPTTEDMIIAGLVAKVDSLTLLANLGLAKGKRGNLSEVTCLNAARRDIT